ncbi:hypothetical protein MCOR04_009235 [Pyricularia oryzae]|nr:hypothetical protein MCOR04_009235 [Pyricularia oryzae]
MASQFRIQKPYELTALPKTLDQSEDTYVVGDVFGQSAGVSSKKRKRSELAVGINGEALNLYNVASSRLITSYPVPPSSSFTCPPVSLRLKNSDGGITRYTYSSTLEPRPKVTLYRDALGASGVNASTTVSQPLPRSQRVMYLAATQSTSTAAYSDLLAVTRTGDVLCLDGESLKQKWQSSAGILKQDTALPASANFRIDFAQAASAADIVQGIFGGDQEQLGLFLPKAKDQTINADILVLLSCAEVDGKELRHVHIVATTKAADGSPANGQGLAQIRVLPFPSRPSKEDGISTYRLDAASGSLMELFVDTVTAYDISSAIPRVDSKLHVSKATSFLRLSKTSVLAATSSELAVYNPLYRSLQASLPVEAAEKQESTMKLVAYFARLEMAVAVRGTSLVAVQLEAPKGRSKKRRAEGLLIDSIGRGVTAPITKTNKRGGNFDPLSFSTQTPPSLESIYGLGSWIDDAKLAEENIKAGDYAEFEKFMAFSFQVHCDDGLEHDGTQDENTAMDVDETSSTSVAATGAGPRRSTRGDGRVCWVFKDRELPQWRFPQQLEPVDRRMVIYAIQRAFNVASVTASTLLGWQLRCRLPWSGTIQYLALAGHLTTANLQTALEIDNTDLSGSEDILAEQLPQVLSEIDPTLDLLLVWLAATKLGPVEILSAVKIIMRSLELIQDPQQMTRNLLSGSGANGTENGNQENGQIGMELDLLEEELHLTEHYLGDDSSTRAEGLSIAFGKLGTCPAVANVRAIRQIFKPEETLSLIYLLRMELNRDGWTSRYLDGARLKEEYDLDAVPDSSIRLIADLLCQCIDSVGPGGWLINDMLSLAAGSDDQPDSADFLNSMKLEVSAALEGVEEAVYLRGVLAEVVKYSSSLSKGITPGGQAATNGPVEGHTNTTTAMLPLGSKATRNAVSKKKVVSGGEVKTRTPREVGHLTSKKVADYTFERILV